MKSFQAKLGNMRKSVEWITYPNSTDERVIIQSDNRICSFNPKTRKGFLSNGKANTNNFVGLHPQLGATEIDVPEEIVKAAIASEPKKGDEVAPGLIIG